MAAKRQKKININRIVSKLSDDRLCLLYENYPTATDVNDNWITPYNNMHKVISRIEMKNTVVVNPSNSRVVNYDIFKSVEKEMAKRYYVIVRSV